MVLDNDFELVHGASWWPHSWAIAEHQGAKFPVNAPDVCVAIVPRHGRIIAIKPVPGRPLTPAVLASVGAIQTDASIVVFEWLVTNPVYAQSLRHWGVWQLMRAGLVYATAVGKRPVMLNVPRGVRLIAERVGFASGKTFEVLMGEMP